VKFTAANLSNNATCQADNFCTKILYKISSCNCSTPYHLSSLCDTVDTQLSAEILYNPAMS